MQHAATWFEIPSTDFDRAVTFYERVLGVQLHREDFNGIPHALFPADQSPEAVGGAVVLDPMRRPNTDGVHLYLPCTDIEASLARTTVEGGTVTTPKTSLGPIGWYGVIIDSEGNTVGLHQRP